MKKHHKLEARRKKIPAETRAFIDDSFAIADQLELILIKKAWSQKDLATALGKSESEISKWMSGVHNFTTKTLAKLRIVLGENVVICPKDVKQVFSNRLYLTQNELTIYYQKRDNTPAQIIQMNQTGLVDSTSKINWTIH